MTTLNSKTITLEKLAKVIDHSLLKPEMTRDEVTAGCELAKKYHAASVCVKPCDVKLAADLLKGSDVLVGTVVGFPHGSSLTATKVFEAKQAMRMAQWNWIWSSISALFDLEIMIWYVKISERLWRWQVIRQL